ncbi:hypothetical protein [Sorangium sp. So ce128]|uniref:hypothetical protein n=1 Tax=Sorangium sp. So ce128 TaxID=3133281 RepID=UPI003F5F7E56
MTVERMRVRGARDPLAVRLRAESLLGAVDLRPSWLPPAAVLIVRSLRVRSSAVFDRGVDASVLRAWERALQAEVDRVARGAARPAREAVPAGAEAVLFNDHAEMLACLARDACDGVIAERWWWAGRLHAGGAERLVAGAFREAPEHVPGALSVLARSGDAVRFVEALTVEERRAVLLPMLEVHGLPALRAVFEAAPEGATSERAPGEDRGELAWRAVVPERMTGETYADALVLVGLMLVRAPSRVRSGAFAEAARRWVHGARPERGAGAAARALSPAGESGAEAREPGDTSQGAGSTATDGRTAASGPEDAPGAAAPMQVDRAREVAPRGDRSEQAAAAPPPTAAGARETSEAHSVRGAPRSDAVEAAAGVSRSRERARDDVAAGRGAEPAVGPGPRPARAQERPEHAGPGDEEPSYEAIDAWEIETALGGVFFLVYVGIRLGLYGDCFTPREPGISLPLWDWLALAGRALLGEGHEDDPVWGLLAALAGRAGFEAPGEGFEAPEGWTLPDEWLVDDGVAPAESSSAAGGRAIDRWIAGLIPHVRARLAEALGVSRGEVAEVMLLRRARVRATASRVDVTMSLADLPIEVRRAGIDRDVGWVPAAGRYVAFWFEA